MFVCVAVLTDFGRCHVWSSTLMARTGVWGKSSVVQLSTWESLRSKAWWTCGASTPPAKRQTCTPSQSRTSLGGKYAALPVAPRQDLMSLMLLFVLSLVSSFQHCFFRDGQLHVTMPWYPASLLPAMGSLVMGTRRRALQRWALLLLLSSAFNCKLFVLWLRLLTLLHEEKGFEFVFGFFLTLSTLFWFTICHFSYLFLEQQNISEG